MTTEPTTDQTTTDQTTEQKKKRRYGPRYFPDQVESLVGDKVPVPLRNAKDKEARGPPLPGEPVPYSAVERQCFTIREFAAAHRLSLRLYYKLTRKGLGPRTFVCGRRVLVSIEAAIAWRAEREAASKEKTTT